jgi:3-hydroxyacyl-CoA dehydrogenase/enoyl-CoA hydratase/3-hydroxybutyryl-CoA epimerase
MNDSTTVHQAHNYETLRYTPSDSGVVYITIDAGDGAVNVLTPELHREIGLVAEQLAADEVAIGAVLHSGKSTFMAGGDLKRIVRYYDMNRSAEEAYTQSRPFTESLRKLETCGKPVAVAINGTALGGGLELALAGHYRVVLDDPDVLLGLPEVTLGLLPAGGGTQRLPRLIGLQKATSLILSGRQVNPAEALELGFIDQLATAEELLPQAERWVIEEGNPEQPWDRKGFRIPGGAKLNDMNIGRLFQISTAKISAKYKHNYPAPIAALRCLFNGTTVNKIDAGLKIETREFSALTRNPVARNIIRTAFINKRQRKFSAEDSNPAFVEACKQAYIAEGAQMLAEGLGPALVENAALAAGMAEGPIALAGNQDQSATGNLVADVATLKLRFLCIQSLTAARFWEDGSVDPVEADLTSTLVCGYPGYTGGVMSYIDTMGLNQFNSTCDSLANKYGERFRPSRYLCELAEQSDRVYPAEV